MTRRDDPMQKTQTAEPVNAGISISEQEKLDLLTEIERALAAGESFDQFQARQFKRLGIDSDEPAGALAELEAQVMTEAREAWNNAVAVANRAKGCNA